MSPPTHSNVFHFEMMNFATAAFSDLAKGDLDHKESDAVGDSLIMITPTTQRAPLSYGNI